jgi:type III restriction enzyme
MNTVGKEGRLGESVRCVVSVAMLTEGWDANTVTHVLGVRAFGTQLLCEQVVGRALRRQSYELNAQDLFNVEYADVLGIPFNFTAQPVAIPPEPPAEVIRVRALRPERDHLEIRFPRVVGYRVELPRDRLQADFNEDSIFELTPELVGPSKNVNAGIIGESAELNLQHLESVRPSTVLMHLTKHLIYSKWRDAGEIPQLHLFGQLKRIVKQWLDECLKCKGGTYPGQLLYRELADKACDRITAAITRVELKQGRPVKAVFDPYNPEGSTRHVAFNTSCRDRFETLGPPPKNHVNFVILDSDWEAEFCRVAEAHPKVIAYTKNHNLGLEVPYRLGAENKKYLPDFIVKVDDGYGASDPLNLIVEVKGYRRENAVVKAETMKTYWIPGVNNAGHYGRWAFVEFRDVYEMEDDFAARLKELFDAMIQAVTP